MSCCSTFFFFNDTATTEIYTLSLHDALPISLSRREKLATKASSVSRSDADDAGSTDASPATFRPLAIIQPDGFADSRRARADSALRNSAPPQRPAARYRRSFRSPRSDRPILAPCRPDQSR